MAVVICCFFLLGQFMNFQAGEILEFSLDAQFHVNSTQISSGEQFFNMMCSVLHVHKHYEILCTHALIGQ